MFVRVPLVELQQEDIVADDLLVLVAAVPLSVTSAVAVPSGSSRSRVTVKVSTGAPASLTVCRGRGWVRHTPGGGSPWVPISPSQCRAEKRCPCDAWRACLSEVGDVRFGESRRYLSGAVRTANSQYLPFCTVHWPVR